MVSLIFTLTASAQLMVTGYVLDIDTKDPLPYASLIVKGSEQGTITNGSGYFSIEVQSLPIVFVISEVAHETRFVRAIEPELEILMSPFEIDLEMVPERDRDEPYFKMANQVLDFDFYNDLILLLGNSGREVRLIDHKGNVIDRSLTPGKFHEVYKDCLNNLHIVGEDTTWQVYYDYEKIRFIHPHPIDAFELYIRNCESRYENGLIYSMGRKRGLVTTFLYASGGNTLPFYEVGDTSKIDYNETNYQLQNFIDQQRNRNVRFASSIDGMQANLERLQAELDLDWVDSRIIHPSAYYVYPEGEKLRVFSLTIMTEFVFDKLGSSPQKSIIKLPESHLDFITRDEVGGRIYAVYRSSMGKVWGIPVDDESDEIIIREYAFPSSVKIRNGHMFFINDPGINGSNFLYRKNEKYGDQLDQ